MIKSTVTHPARRLRTRLLGLATVATLGLALVGCGGGSDDTIVVETTTATPTPTATSTPTPTPTPEPWPIAAEKIPLGERAAILENPTSVGFPPPPQVVLNAQPNDAGIVRMFAPALGMDHVIEVVGVVDGVMEEPVDGSYAIGWYAPDERWDFGTPDKEGNLVFSAHETWNHMQGPFYNLHQARVGDDIYLEMANGDIRHYQVARLDRYDVATIPMREVLWPSDRPEAEQWLTLYTCGGEIIYGDRGYGDYLARDVLVAKWVGMGGPEGEPVDETTQQAVETTTGD
ncbi:MAG: class F sortase [Dehalococcoidia bacterium]